MKKILFLLFTILYPVFSFGAISECLTDVYYANGILAEEEDVRLNTLDLLSPAIESNIYGTEEEMKKHIGEVGYSYNQTSGNMPQDGWETYMQKFGVQGFIDLWLALKGYITTHLEDVEEHIKKYSNRIKLGHKVLVIAHSQGNLFTNEIYKALGKRSENAWMQDYFGAVSVASPMQADIKDDTVRITWDNDGVGRLIAHNGSVDPDEVLNPIRSVDWEGSYDYNDFNVTAEVIPTPYARLTQIDKVVGVGNERFGYLGHKAIENGLDLLFNVHAFTYYMGEPLSRDVEIDIPLVPFADGTIVKKAFKDPFDKNKTLQTNRAKGLIISAIKEQLDLLDKVNSQWIMDQEFEKNTCNYKITLKHQYDSSIEMAEKVYPFNASKKLYQVNGEYVKASCGGENILGKGHDIITWDGKKDNECWMIDNVEEEKIYILEKKYSINLHARAEAGENMCAELMGGVWIGIKTVHSHCNMQTGSCSYNRKTLCDKSVAYTSTTFNNMLTLLNKSVENLKNKLANVDPMIRLEKFEVKPISSYEHYSACYSGDSSGTGKEIVYKIDIEIMSSYTNLDIFYSKIESIMSEYGFNIMPF